MNCIDLMSKLSKMLRYVAKHSKHRKSTKLIKLQWIASIWCENDQKRWGTSQNIQNNAKLQKQSNYNGLHRFDVKTIKNVELRRKTTNVIKLRWICIDLTSKRSKMLSYVAKHSKQRKTTKVIKLQWIASIWRQNDLKSWVTSQNYKSDQIIMNCINLTSKRSKKLSYVPKLQKKSNYNELHRFDVKTIRNVELRRKTFKTTQNYESHQITMNCIDLMSKTSNQRKTTKVILFRWICNRFDVKTIKTFELVRSQNYKSNQITMNCIDLTSKRSKLLSYVAKLQSNRITMNCIDLMSKRSRMLSYVAKHSKQRKTTKVIKLQWIASIWRQNDHNNAKLQSDQIIMHCIDVELRPQNYKSDQITMNLHRFESKRSKMLRYVAKHSKQRKTTNEIKLQWICIDLTSERSKMLSYVAKLQMWSYYDEFASIWRQNDHNNA